jgi:hypothetical protein
MFSVTKYDIDQVSRVYEEVYGEIDFEHLGVWGILFFCCGSLSVEHAKKYYPGHTPDYRPITCGEKYANQFSDFIKSWTQENIGKALASQKLSSFEDIEIGTKARNKLCSFFAISIMINSYKDSQDETLVEIKQWVESSELGWGGMFFAAGILLSQDPEVDWKDWKDSLIILSKEKRGKIEHLFHAYHSPLALNHLIHLLSEARSSLRYQPETLYADIALSGLTFDVIESISAVRVLANTQFPHKAYPTARTAFEAAQQAMVLVTHENYALAGARALIYFYKKDSRWLASSKPDGSGVKSKEDAEQWFRNKIGQMAATWEDISPGKGQIIFEADKLLTQEEGKKKADNWLYRKMAHYQDQAYRKVAKFLGNKIS